MRTTIFTRSITSTLALAATACSDLAQDPTIPAAEAPLALSLSCSPQRLDFDGCLTPEALRKEAALACGEAELGAVTAQVYCGDGAYRAVAFDCCGGDGAEVTPPSATPAVGEGVTCRPVESAPGVCTPESDLLASLRLQCGADVLTDFSWGEPCKGGASSLRAACCEAPPPPEAALPCAPVDVALPNVCVSPETLERLARAECSAQGRVMSSFKPIGDCGGGAFFSARAACCDTVLQTYPEGTQTGSCSAAVLGGPDQCFGASELAAMAQAQCAGQGLGVSEVSLFGACGEGRTRYARATCCSTFRAEEQCVQQALDGDYCAPEGVWELAGQSACATLGRHLAGVQGRGTCGDGVWSGADTICCGGTSADAPAAAPGCFDTSLVNSECRDLASWQRDAQAFCELRGTTAGAVEVEQSCGALGVSRVHVTCCPGIRPPSACSPRVARLPGQCADRAAAEAAAASVCAAEGGHTDGVVPTCGDAGTDVRFACCE